MRRRRQHTDHGRRPGFHLGFTLIEVLVVALLLAIILVPIFVLLRSGAKTSLEGMLRIDTTMEARRVLQQVHADLKQACFSITLNGDNGFGRILTETGSSPELTFSFLSYPLHEKIEDIVNKTAPSRGRAPRQAARITYVLERQPHPEKPFLKLTRHVKFPGKQPRSRVLSERVNLLEIKPIEIQAGGRNQFYYWVILQIVDTAHGLDTAAMSAGTVMSAGQAGVMLADFFDVVYPEYFHAYWNCHTENPTWHAGLEGPP